MYAIETSKNYMYGTKATEICAEFFYFFKVIIAPCPPQNKGKSVS